MGVGSFLGFQGRDMASRDTLSERLSLEGDTRYQFSPQLACTNWCFRLDDFVTTVIVLPLARKR